MPSACSLPSFWHTPAPLLGHCCPAEHSAPSELLRVDAGVPCECFLVAEVGPIWSKGKKKRERERLLGNTFVPAPA